MVAVVALVVDLASLDSTKDATHDVAMSNPEVSSVTPKVTEYPWGRMASPENDASYAEKQPSSFLVPFHALSHVLAAPSPLSLSSPSRAAPSLVAPSPSFPAPPSPSVLSPSVPSPAVPLIPSPSPLLLALP